MYFLMSIVPQSKVRSSPVWLMGSVSAWLHQCLCGVFGSFYCVCYGDVEFLCCVSVQQQQRVCE